jgi:hypothetical protein
VASWSAGDLREFKCVDRSVISICDPVVLGAGEAPISETAFNSSSEGALLSITPFDEERMLCDVDV